MAGSLRLALGNGVPDLVTSVMDVMICNRTFQVRIAGVLSSSLRASV
jgi:hypothetical protein